MQALKRFWLGSTILKLSRSSSHFAGAGDNVVVDRKQRIIKKVKKREIKRAQHWAVRGRLEPDFADQNGKITKFFLLFCNFREI